MPFFIIIIFLKSFAGFLGQGINTPNLQLKFGLSLSECCLTEHLLLLPSLSCFLQAYFYVLCIFILTSFFAIAAETTKNDSTNKDALFIVQLTCAGGLYLDFVFRIVSCPSFTYFFRDPINLTDGIAVLSNIGKSVVEGPLVSATDGYTLLIFINILQLLRILRLLRPMSKVTGFRLIYFTLKCSFRELLLVLMLLMFLMIVFSSLLYYVGDREDIKSIPHGMWFSLITMTTVGYGDIAPKSVSVMSLLFLFFPRLLADYAPS